uniref:Uncharacterized protein n=1 Tax=Arundo donax TaxID=35708 RepID=A0A0A9F5M0_ARUDO
MVGLEEAVDDEAGAERARRRQAEEGGEPGYEVGEDAVGEEQRDEDPLQQRVGEHPSDAVSLLAQRRREVDPRHGRLRAHPRSSLPWQPPECDQNAPTSQPEFAVESKKAQEPVLSLPNPLPAPQTGLERS